MKLEKDQEKRWIMLLAGVAVGSLLGLLYLIVVRMNTRRSRFENEDEREAMEGTPPIAPRIRIIPFRAGRKNEPPLQQGSAEEPPVHHPERKWDGGTRDVVDEASWESFPASDPPAW